MSEDDSRWHEIRRNNFRRRKLYWYKSRRYDTHEKFADGNFTDGDCTDGFYATGNHTSRISVECFEPTPFEYSHRFGSISHDSVHEFSQF